MMLPSPLEISSNNSREQRIQDSKDLVLQFKEPTDAVRIMLE